MKAVPAGATRQAARAGLVLAFARPFVRLFMRPMALAVFVLAGELASTAQAATPQGQASRQTLELSCAVAYLPARSTWVRTVQMEWDAQRVQALRIDGLTPYSFALLPEGVSTAIDNERIEIDLRALTWRSDFRGQASGQGRCERSAG